MKHASPTAGELRFDLIRRSVDNISTSISAARAKLEAGTKTEQLEILVELANWIDLDFSLRSKVSEALKRWPEQNRGNLTHREGLLLRFVDGVVAMHVEDYENAVGWLEEVRKAEKTLADPLLHAVVLFYIARCRHYQGGDVGNTEAERIALETRQCASHLEEGTAVVTALIDILRSRILLKSRPFKEAAPQAAMLLEGALPVFKSSGDHLMIGTILTFNAEISRRGPHVGKSALELLDEAVSEINRHPAEVPHPALARALSRRARARRDQVLVLKQELTREPQQQREEYKDALVSSMLELGPLLVKVLEPHHAEPLQEVLDGMNKWTQRYTDRWASHERPRKRPSIRELEKTVDDMQNLSLADLRAAKDIYDALGHWRGSANSSSFIGYEHMDRGEYVDALTAGKTAYALGNKIGDHTVQVRAALLCTSACCMMFEEFEDGVDHAGNAREWAETAMGHAHHVEPRNVGRAHALKGISCLLGTPGPEAHEKATFHRDKAKDILRKFPGGSLQRDFDILQKYLNSEEEAADVLREWATIRRGKRFDELETAITRIGWAETGNIPDFMKRLTVQRNKAIGLLERAGIFKMPDSSEERRK